MDKIVSIPLLLFLLLLCSFSPVDGLKHAQQSNGEWKLDKDANGIKVYTRRPAKSTFDEVKVETSIKAPLSQVVAIIEDLSGQKEWAYATKSNTLLNHISTGQFEFHYFMDMPFPVKDKDVIINYTRTQDEDTKVVTIVSKATRHTELISDKYTRLKDFTSIYRLESYPDGTVSIIYKLNADPGSNVPAWIINMFTTTGPYKSMESLLKLIKKGKHKDTVVEGLM